MELHITDEMLEGYLLATLSRDDFDCVEEHLLVCEQCRTRCVIAERRAKVFGATAGDGQIASDMDFSPINRAKTSRPN